MNNIVLIVLRASGLQATCAKALGRATRNKQCEVILPQDSNLQPLNYRPTILTLELESMPLRMRNFGYLNN